MNEGGGGDGGRGESGEDAVQGLGEGAVYWPLEVLAAQVCAD